MAPLRRRINPFVVITLSLVALGYAYLAWQLLPAFELTGPRAVAAWLGFAVPFGLILWLPLVYWQKDEPSSRDELVLWAAFCSMALLSFLLFFTVARDLLLLAARAYGLIAGIWSGAGPLGGAAGGLTGWAAGPSYVPLPLLDHRGSLLIFGLAAGAFAWGLREARREPAVSTVDVPIDRLPPQLAGLRIVQISDLHISPTIRRPYVERVVRRVNSLAPDIVTMTGDLVDGTVERLGADFSALKDLAAPLGRYYVTGNHEFYWGHIEWIEHARTCGITPLANEHVVLERDGAKLVIAGVLDLWATRNGGSTPSDPSAALRGAPKDAAVRVLLAHQPRSALAATTLGYDLQLSGHTHAGQFLPWTFVVRGFQPFVRGLHRVGRMWLYVNRGTGYWGPPVRLGARSEITLIRLVKA